VLRVFDIYHHSAWRGAHADDGRPRGGRGNHQLIHRADPESLAVAPHEKRGLRRFGLAGIAFGLMSLALCELPLVLALIGFGSLGSAAMMLKPHPLLEVASLVAAVTGMVLVVFLAVLHRRKKTQGKYP